MVVLISDREIGMLLFIRYSVSAFLECNSKITVLLHVILLLFVDKSLHVNLLLSNKSTFYLGKI